MKCGLTTLNLLVHPSIAQILTMIFTTMLLREYTIFYIEDPSEALCEPLGYEEVAHVCSRLKPGAASVSIDYEHIRYAGAPLQKAPFCLYRVFFVNGSVCQILKT